jgi:hypothetical protein
MGILDNLENAWDEEFSFEHKNLAVQIFSDTCCDGCTCKSYNDHKQEEFYLDELDLDI